MFRNIILIAIAGAATLVAIGCAPEARSTNATTPSTAQVTSSEAQDAVGCPAQVPGTRVAVQDADGGVAITYLNDGAGVAKVRDAARRMVAMHNGHQVGSPGGMDRDMHGSMMGGMQHGGGSMDCAAMHGGGMMGGGHGDGDHAGGMHERMGGMAEIGMVPSVAEARDIDSGVEIVLRPVDAAQLDTLREQVRTRHEQAGAAACPLMAMHQHG